MYVNYNANPVGLRADDCTIRAISKATDQTWDRVYCDLCEYGRYFFDMPTSNYVWGEYLKDYGWTRQNMPRSCSVKQFSEDYNVGSYVLALHGHVVAVVNGNYYDTWDSGDEIVLYYWQRGE